MMQYTGAKLPEAEQVREPNYAGINVLELVRILPFKTWVNLRKPTSGHH
jgi:hypothetical protein